MTVAFIIPFRGTNNDKSRLRLDLEDAIVEKLLFLMFQHVLSEINKVELDKVVYVVTKNTSLPINNKVILLEDNEHSLNAALTTAISKVTEDNIIIVMADLPYISSLELQNVSQILLGETDVILVPTEDRGTSLLGLKKPLSFPLSFGIKSFEKHISIMKSKGLTFFVPNDKELFRDIDTLKDLKESFQNNLTPDWINSIIKEVEKHERKN